MNTGLWFRLLATGVLLAGFIAGAAAEVTLGTDWKERAPEEGPYSGVMILPDASLVYAGGNEMVIRSWDDELHWGGRFARVAAFSNDGTRVAMGVGTRVSVVDDTGTEYWSRTMDGYIMAVAIAPDGSYVISADDKGNYNAWGRDGEFIARLENQTAVTMAYSPAGDLVVVATESGLRFYNHRLELIRYEDRPGSRDEFIAIASDGSTVIAAGHNQVASYTRDGTLTWRKEITTDPIIDMRCSSDCSVIVVGGQDKEIVAIDRFGSVHWRYKTGEWVNAVGVSGSASVIAAGGTGRTVYVLDRSGTLVAAKKTDAIIQPRSIAVSSTGDRIVVADQMNLYGFSLMGDTAASGVPATTARAPPGPVPAGSTVSTAATSPVITAPATTPGPRATYSPPDPLLAVPALGAAVLISRRMRE